MVGSFRQRQRVFPSLSQNVANPCCELASFMLLYYTKCYDYLVGSRTYIFFISHDYWVGSNLDVMKHA